METVTEHGARNRKPGLTYAHGEGTRFKLNHKTVHTLCATQTILSAINNGECKLLFLQILSLNLRKMHVVSITTRWERCPDRNGNARPSMSSFVSKRKNTDFCTLP